jgi:asparagine synthase (glutamine-hydrolysing)
MSAIFGVVRWDGRPVVRREIERMSERLSHRGSDGSGVWVDGSVGLGHRMRHAMPESVREHQPLHWATPSLTITADARIDNRDELIAALGLRARAREGIADSQVILAAYERWGEECPQRLIGDFAFAIWDSRVRRLFCARDPMGVKPLAYYRTKELFVFASEIKALFCVGVPRVVDEVQTAMLLEETVDDAERTLFQGVLRLPAAHSLTAGPGGRSWRYWMPDPEREIRLSSDQEYAEQFRDVFREAVRCRLRTQHPIATALSGGLDSSSIACMARDLLQRSSGPTLHAFSAIFPSLPPEALRVIDERRFMDAVICAGGIEPHFVRVDEVSPLHEIDRMTWHFDQASIAYNMYMHWALFGAAQDVGCRVFLDGLDGDTTVGHGTGLLDDMLAAGRWDAFAEEVKAIAHRVEGKPGRLLHQHAIAHLTQRARAGEWRRWAQGVRQLRRHFDLSLWHCARSSVFSPLILQPARAALRGGHSRLLSRWIAPRLAEQVHRQRQVPRVPNEGIEGSSSRHEHARSFLRPIFQYALELCDKAAAPFALEPRFPFFDRRLIEFCVALPMEQRLSHGWTRAILRRAMTDVLPPEVQWRPGKQNLSPNFIRGLKGRDRALVDSAILSDASALGKIANLMALRRAYQRFMTRLPNGWNSWADETALYRAAVLNGWLASEVIGNPYPQTYATATSTHA